MAHAQVEESGRLSDAEAWAFAEDFISRLVIPESTDCRPAIVGIVKSPGMGGTTLGRHIAKVLGLGQAERSSFQVNAVVRRPCKTDWSVAGEMERAASRTPWHTAAIGRSSSISLAWAWRAGDCARSMSPMSLSFFRPGTQPHGSSPSPEIINGSA